MSEFRVVVTKAPTDDEADLFCVAKGENHRPLAVCFDELAAVFVCNAINEYLAERVEMPET